MIRRLLKKLRRTKQTPQAANGTYPTYVWVRQVNERLLHLEAKLRDLGAGEADQVVAARAEFEMLTAANKDSLLQQIHRHDEILLAIAQRLDQIEAADVAVDE